MPLIGSILPTKRMILSASRPSFRRASARSVGLKTSRSKPQGDDVGLARIGPVEAEKLLALVGARGDQGVGIGRDLVLGRQALLGVVAAGPAPDQALHLAQCMEARYHGDVPTSSQFERRRPGEPVVAVDEIVGEGIRRDVATQGLGERWEAAVEVLLRFLRRSRVEVNQASARAQIDDGWVVRVVRPGEDVDADPAPPELFGGLAEEDVHAPGVFLTEPGDGASVDADEGDAQRGLRARRYTRASTRHQQFHEAVAAAAEIELVGLRAAEEVKDLAALLDGVLQCQDLEHESGAE